MSSLVRKACIYPLSAALIVGAGAAVAGELIYQPINPSFGGNPLLGNHLLNKAQAQDTNKDPNAPDFGRFSEVDFFLQDLRAGLINDSIEDALSGENRDGIIDSSTLRITISGTGQGGFMMRIEDKTTGEETIISLGHLAQP